MGPSLGRDQHRPGRRPLTVGADHRRAWKSLRLWVWGEVDVAVDDDSPWVLRRL